MAKSKVKKTEIDGHVFKKNVLCDFIDRWMRVDDEQRRDNRDRIDEKKDIFTDAKHAGYHPKILRRVIAQKKRVQSEMDMPEGERRCLSMYRATLGLEGTPLGEFSKKKNKASGAEKESSNGLTQEAAGTA